MTEWLIFLGIVAGAMVLSSLCLWMHRKLTEDARDWRLRNPPPPRPRN